MKEIPGYPRENIPKSREEHLTEVRDTRAAYDQNPFDKQNVKKWITSLMKATGRISSIGNRIYEQEDHELLFDAKSKLEAALETDERDWDTMFELGHVYYKILQWDSLFTCDYTSDEFKNIHSRAVGCFKKVKENAPNLGRTDAMLEGLERFLPRVYSSVEASDSDSEELDDFGAIYRYRQYRKEAESEFFRDSTAENAYHWGRALMGLAFYTADPTERLASTEEAEKRFEKASELEPDDIYYKLEVAKARLSICSLKQGDDYAYLQEECDKLENAVEAVEAVEEEESRKRKRDS